jgi:hypothetical protein
MGDTWWVIIICLCVNVFSLMGGVTEADVGFPTMSYEVEAIAPSFIENPTLSLTLLPELTFARIYDFMIRL